MIQCSDSDSQSDCEGDNNGEDESGTRTTTHRQISLTTTIAIPTISPSVPATRSCASPTDVSESDGDYDENVQRPPSKRLRTARGTRLSY